MDAVSPITERATLWRLGHMIDAHAETAPGSTALMVGDQRRRITYADLAELVVDHCAALLRRGLHSGDVIGLRSSNSIEFVVALLGAARADIVVATLDPALPWTERRARMDRVGARAVLTDARRADPIGGEADCPEWCLHITTSGAKPEMQLLAPDPGRDVASPLSGLTTGKHNDSATTTNGPASQSSSRPDHRPRYLFGPARHADGARAGHNHRAPLCAVYIGFSDGATPELVSERLGCIIDQAEYRGLDLAALCFRH